MADYIIMISPCVNKMFSVVELNKKSSHYLAPDALKMSAHWFGLKNSAVNCAAKSA